MAALDHRWGLPFWLDIPRPAYPELEGERTADVAVIGAGIAGVKLGRALARRGREVVLLDAGQVGDGASGRNQGSINHGPGFGYAEAVHRYTRPVARLLWQLGLENHRLLRGQIEEYAVDCDYEVGGMFMLARRDAEGFEAALDAYREDHALLAEDGFDVALLDEREARAHGGSPLYAGGLVNRADAQFHSGKYVTGLARGVARDRRVRIFERSRVQTIEREGSVTRVATARGAVTAPDVVLATNALVPQFVPGLEPGLRAERGQVLVTRPLAERPCRGSFGTAMAWWREILEPGGGYRLLFGGGRRRDEPDSLFRQFDAAGRPHPELERGGFSPSEAHQRRLEHELRTIFPAFADLEVTHRWGGLQCFTADELPIVGLFDPARRIHGMAGFSGRGNCFADAGAEFLAGRIAGTPSAIEERFGRLFEELLGVGRRSSIWRPWVTSHE